MATDLYALLARRIREERHRAGLSIEKLAEAAGIGSSFLGHIETQDRKPSVATIGRLASALRVPAAALLADPTSAKGEPDHAYVVQFAELIRGKTPTQKTAILNTLKTLAKNV